MSNQHGKMKLKVTKNYTATLMMMMMMMMTHSLPNTHTTCHSHAWIGTPLRNHSTFSLGSPTGIRRASK